MVIAVVLVGVAGTQVDDAATDDGVGDDGSSNGVVTASAADIIVGLLFILAAQLVCAIQIITEEKLMVRAQGIESILIL